MIKHTANFISYLLHPILMPLLGVIIILNSDIYQVEIAWQLQKMIYMIVFLFSIILPVLFLMSIYSLKLITDIKLPVRKERFLPLFFTTISLYITHYFLDLSGGIRLISSFLLGIVITMILALALSIFFKISLHMLGVGGLTGLLLAIFGIYHINVYYPFVILILISGILGTSRLVLDAHRPYELIIGYFSGLLVIYFSLLFMVY